MMRTISKALVLGLLSAGAIAVRAMEPDEPRAEARAIQKETASQSERGERQAAERREREDRAADQDGERREAQARRQGPGLETRQEIEHLQGRLQDLLAKQKKLVEAKAPEQVQAEIRDQLAVTRRELDAVRERLAGGRQPRPEFEAQARKIEEAARRIHHIRVAVENLEAAGVHELAVKLTEQAGKMEREVGEARERLAGEIGRPGGPDPRGAEVRELRRQNERLQAEIRELRQNLEKR